jgi:hypothetical protein
MPEATEEMTSEEQQEKIQQLSVMEEGDSESIRAHDTMNIADPRPKLLTHLSIMGEDSPLLGQQRKPRPLNKRCLVKTWKNYQRSIETRPVLTKCLTSGVLTGLAEIVSQLLTHPNYLEIYQMLEFFLLGLVLQAPISHYYYLALDRSIPPTPRPWTWTTLIKLLIDQLFFCPSFLFAVFVFLDVLDGRSMSEMEQHLRNHFWSTLVTNWKVWVPATLLNLALVAPEYRVLYSNVVFFGWSIILAMLLHAPTTTT